MPGPPQHSVHFQESQHHHHGAANYGLNLQLQQMHSAANHAAHPDDQHQRGPYLYPPSQGRQEGSHEEVYQSCIPQHNQILTHE